MTHGTEHHVEESEHAQHAAQDPFTRRVAMTMAIVAATLACETLLSHRAHNATLSNQIKANDNITERANVFGRYQAKKNRQYQAEANAQLLTANAVVLAALAGDDKGDRGQRLREASKQARDDAQLWKDNATKWKRDAAEILQQGNKLNPEIKKYEEEAESFHHRSDFFDLGELGVELALVLCSIAVLTRGRAFWYVGIVVGAIGLAVAVAGFFVGRHAEGHPPGPEPTGRHEEARLAPRLRNGRPAGASPATGLDEAVDAQQHKRRAQPGHRGGADAGDALHRALVDQRLDHAPARGQEADDAKQRGQMHGLLEEALLQRQQAEQDERAPEVGGDQGGAAEVFRRRQAQRRPQAPLAAEAAPQAQGDQQQAKHHRDDRHAPPSTSPGFPPFVVGPRRPPDHARAAP
jgi:hypothetical protein